MIQAHEARVNVTHLGSNGELPDPVPYNSTDAEIRQWISEAIRTGSIPGIAADPTVDLSNYMVDKFDAPVNPVAGQRDYNLLTLRPKVAYG